MRGAAIAAAAALLATAASAQSLNHQMRAPSVNTTRVPTGDGIRQPPRPRGPGWGGIGAGIAIGVAPAIGSAIANPGPPHSHIVTDDNDDPLPGQPRRTPTQGNRGGQGNRQGFSPPPPSERRFVPNEVILEIAANVPDATLEALARQNRLTRLESHTFALTGRKLFRWRINDNRPVASVIRSLSDQRIAAAQPNYLYALQQQSDERASGDAAQYTLAKLRVPEAHRVATGENVLVAVIDSAIDESHPDLVGAVADRLDLLGGSDEPHPHGTGVAGAIASRGKLTGVAPRVRILAVRAFGPSARGGEGTTFHILRGLDWAYSQGARVMNMSFAGPADPALQRTLAAARQKGIVLVAAAGNAGPKSPPLFPAADPNVIAVTATDTEDKVFIQANRGNHIAVAAPGVDILIPAPNRSYQISSGTSVAAAHVSGVVALMMERNAKLDPDSVRKILMATAKGLGPKRRDPDFGAGLADAYEAARSAEPRTADRSSTAVPSR